MTSAAGGDLISLSERAVDKVTSHAPGASAAPGRGNSGAAAEAARCCGPGNAVERRVTVANSLFTGSVR